MAAALVGLRRLATRTSLRSVVVLHQNFKNYATQDTVTHTGQVINESYLKTQFKNPEKKLLFDICFYQIISELAS